MRPDKKVVSDRFHSDIIDAVLYGFKESPAYAWEPPKIKPKEGTPQWAKEEEDSMYQAELNRLTQEQTETGMDWL